jgi:Fe-S-cluster containining protein
VRRLPAALDCRTCGACCVDLDRIGYVADLGERDESRMGARRLRRYAERSDVSALSSTRAVERGGWEVCSALRGTPGRRCSCAIYEVRPRVCRAFRAGSAGCRQARRDAGVA